MLKWLIDIDVRKVTAIGGVLVFLCVPLGAGEVPLHNAVPENWIPHIEAWATIIAWLAGGVTGTHNIAALMSPKATP